MGQRILLVENNDLNRKLFCEVLRSQGFTVESVGDGSQALERARRFDPDLIIIDIQMPNISGLDLIAAVKADATLNHVAVLAMTAYAGKGDEDRIRAAGAAGYLAKPVSMGPFMAAVRALLKDGPQLTRLPHLPHRYFPAIAATAAGMAAGRAIGR